MYRMEITLTTLEGKCVDEAIITSESLYFLHYLQQPILGGFYANGSIAINKDYSLHVLLEKEGENGDFEYEDSEEIGVSFVYDQTTHNTKVRTEDGFEFEI